MVAAGKSPGEYWSWDHPCSENTRMKLVFGLGCCVVRMKGCWAELVVNRWWAGGRGDELTGCLLAVQTTQAVPGSCWAMGGNVGNAAGRN